MLQALTLGPRRMVVQYVEPPSAGKGQAVIDVDVVGLCGSDYHLFAGDHPYATFPQRQGHEFGGRIAELPANYDGTLEVGQRVAVEPLLPCFTCFACRRGRYNCCARLQVMGAHAPGALAERVAVPLRSLYPVGDLPAELTALVEPVSIGFQAVRRGQVSEGDHVVVIGAGPIGLTAALAACDIGARVMVVDKVAGRLATATDFGADQVVDSTQHDVAACVTDWTAGDGAAVAIDATGAPAVIRTALQVTAPSGAVVIVGISDQEVSIPVIDFSRKELSVYGSRNNAGLFPESIELVRRNAATVQRLITHRFPLADAPSALTFAAANPQVVQKALILIGARL